MWRLLLILELLLAPGWAFGQTNADGYFHAGAQNYIFGDKAEAKKAIDTGLGIYPTDEKLNAVARLLLRKDPENQNQPKNSPQNQKQNQDQKNQQNQQPQSGAQNQQNQQNQAQQQSGKQGQQNQSGQANATKKGQQGKESAPDQQTASGTPVPMTIQQAMQMLDAQKDGQKVLIFSAQNQPGQTVPGKTIKDW